MRIRHIFSFMHIFIIIIYRQIAFNSLTLSLILYTYILTNVKKRVLVIFLCNNRELM